MKKGHYRKIPILFDLETGELLGRNWFYDQLLDIALWIDITFNLLPEEGFPIWLDEE